MTPQQAAREAVDETELDDVTCTATRVCADIHCMCEERRNDRMQPAECVAYWWAWRGPAETGVG